MIFQRVKGRMFLPGKLGIPWSSLVEGDEQVDQPNSQTTMELCHARVA